MEFFSAFLDETSKLAKKKKKETKNKLSPLMSPSAAAVSGGLMGLASLGGSTAAKRLIFGRSKGPVSKKAIAVALLGALGTGASIPAIASVVKNKYWKHRQSKKRLHTQRSTLENTIGL